MRFSLGPVGDVDVEPGATVADCRPALAGLLPELAAAPLSVDGAPLARDQVAGVHPWRAGCHVRVGADPDPSSPCLPAEAAARAPWHVAVVTGPDAGAVAVPGPDGALLVGRAPGGPAAAAPGGGRLALADPAVSRRHIALRSGRRRVLVHDAGSANGTAVLRRGRWRRLRWVARVRPGGALAIGGTVLEVRRQVAVADTVADAAADKVADPVADPLADPLADERGGSPTARPALTTWLVPLVIAVGLAAATRSPFLLLMATVGPLTAAAGALSGRLARRRAARRPAASPAGALTPDAAAASVRLAGGATDPPGWWALAREGLAVVGDAAERRSVARALIGGAVLDPRIALTLLHGADDEPAWRWARWLEDRLGGAADARVRAAGPLAFAAGPGPHLVVSDGLGEWRADLERWWLSADGDRAAVVLTDRPPAWCRWVLTVPTVGAGTLNGPSGVARVPVPHASLPWAEAHARRVAARDATAGTAPGGGPTSGGLPARVSPGDVGLPADVPGVVATWGGPAAGRRRLPGLAVPIGLGGGVGGPTRAWLDLVADGPHALVAGTTGSGKSELLQALVLGLALRHPPAELVLVLLDFKGGAGLRPCWSLPHVVGRVTDLDPEQATRALEALAAELRRREAVLAAAGVADVEDLRGNSAPPATQPLPRMLVVVDEFRALAEDLPEFVPALVRLAAQGRSLGMHLVLATQRPGGAVTAQMRANLALRVCLRVTEAADSADVVDGPEAARISPGTPGRAVVRGADGVPRLIQAVWPALRTPGGPLRRARPWAEFGTGPGTGTVADAAHATALAGLATEAAARLGIAPAAPLWSPPLPERVGVHDLAPLLAGVPPGRLVLGLTDPEGAGPPAPLTWDGLGVLLVAGGPRSGRTTVLATTARTALAAGTPVHAVGAVGRLMPAGHPALGTVLAEADPRRLARLLTLLLARDAASPPCVLVLDDLAAAVAAGEAMPRGAGAGLVERLAREAVARRVGLVVAGHPRDVVRLAPLAAARLVLPVADPADDSALGVPRGLGGRRLPGRAVLLAGTAAVRCHIAMPADPDPWAAGSAVASGPAADTVRPGPPPTRLAPLPDRVTWRAAPQAEAAAGAPVPAGGAHGGHLAVVGLGGDDAGPVTVAARPGVLVVGPPASGRSTALATLAADLTAAGARVAVVAPSGPLRATATRLGLPAWSGAAGALALVREPAGLDALVVDDLDLLARASPELDDALAAWVHAAEAGDAAVPAVLASCRTDRAAAAYRGGCAALRGAATIVVLAPAEPGSAEVAGIDLAAVTDPVRPRHAGRGAVVARGRATPVQVGVVVIPTEGLADDL